MRPMIVSFATATPALYPVAREHLIADCNRLGLEHSIRIVPNKGGWYPAVRYKPYFLKELLEGKVWTDCDQPHCRPYAWVDVDSRLNRVDELPQEPFDIGYHQATGSMDYACGILVLQRTPDALRFVEAWIARMVREGTPGEHGPLVRTIKDPPPGVRLADVTGCFGWDVNERMRDICKRVGPVKCPACGRGYDEALQGRQLVCRQCGKTIML